MIKWVLLLFLLAGCSGDMSLLNSEAQSNATDLDDYIAQNGGGYDNPETGDVNLADAAADLNQAGEPGAAPSWSRKLHQAVENSDSGQGGKLAAAANDAAAAEASSSSSEKKAGKKRRSKPVSRDLVGDADGSGQAGQTERAGQTINPRDLAEQANPRQLCTTSCEPIIDADTSVDILFVIDASRSMARHLNQGMREKVIEFLPAVSALDWRIGFLRADVRSSGQLADLELNGEVIQNMRYFTKNTRNYEQIFLDSITQRKCRRSSGCSSSRERPLGALENYLASRNDDFLREGAALKVVIISDNDENKYSRKWQRTTSEHVLRTFRSQFGEHKSIQGYSVTVLDDECRKEFHLEGHYAPIINEFVDRTTGPGGQFSLCLPSYSVVGEVITQDHLDSVL